MHKGLTVESEALTFVDTGILVQEEFEVAIWISDGAYFIIFVDKVAARESAQN